MTTVLLIDDDRSARLPLTSKLLEGQCAVKASSGDASLKELKAFAFDVVVINLATTPIGGMAALEYLTSARLPSLPIVIGELPDSKGTRLALDQGVLVLAAHPRMAEQLASIIVARTGTSAGRPAGGLAPPRADDVMAFSSRERQIIDGVLAGCSNRTISHMVGTTEQVVKNNLTRLYRRVCVRNRIGLVNALRDRRGHAGDG